MQVKPVVQTLTVKKELTLCLESPSDYFKQGSGVKGEGTAVTQGMLGRQESDERCPVAPVWTLNEAVQILC